MKQCLFIFFLYLSVSIPDGKDDDIIKGIRKKYETVTNGIATKKYFTTSIEYECADRNESGYLAFYSEGKKLRMIEHSYSSGDHSGEKRQYYVWNDSLFFAFYDGSAWSFDPLYADSSHQSTIDYYTEERFYFHKNEAVRCLEKHYEVHSADSANPSPEEIQNTEAGCGKGKDVLDDFFFLLKYKNTKIPKDSCFRDY